MPALYIGVLVLSSCSINVIATCLNGYIRHDDSCYHLSHDVETWMSAMFACQLDGGSLVEIESDRENNFVTNLLKNGSVYRAWIGGADLDVEGEWLWWKTKEPLTYTHWYTGEPNNAGKHHRTEDCLEIRNSTFWNDYECNSLVKYICESRIDGGAEVIG